ncbi:MAG TPA: NADPH-dependent F420 reductase [Nitrososphaera sp.]|nr:NADPH-dependent F420 reductase [Nitrososphaera sp.]
MQIGILGSGDVGLRLADSFIATGHTVKVGTRSPEKIASWAAKHASKAFADSFSDAASFGEIIVLATLWEGTPSALQLAGAKNFSGKVVIDVTNPLDFSKGAPPGLSVGHTDSGGETVQRLLPEARVVKAFNIVGNPHMFKPDFPGGPPTMFICGNDERAKKLVTEMLAAFGWETIDIGGIEGSRLLEPLAMLWIAYYFKTGTGNHAFKLLRK